MKQPRSAPHSVTNREGAEHRRHHGQAPPVADHGAPPAMRILVVDDSRVSRELMKVYLIARDVELLEAADGFEAMDVIRSHRPDLVLADVRMPRLDGFGLCAALRSNPALAGIPVVILTSFFTDEAVLRLRAAGAREVLQVEFPELAGKIAFHIPNEKDKRHGQAVAAASLPGIRPS